MACMRVCLFSFLHHYLDNYYSIIILYIHAYYLQKSCSLETAPTSRPIHSLHTYRGVLFDFPTCMETAIKKSCIRTRIIIYEHYYRKSVIMRIVLCYRSIISNMFTCLLLVASRGVIIQGGAWLFPYFKKS